MRELEYITEPACLVRAGTCGSRCGTPPRRTLKPRGLLVWGMFDIRSFVRHMPPEQCPHWSYVSGRLPSLHYNAKIAAYPQYIHLQQHDRHAGFRFGMKPAVKKRLEVSDIIIIALVLHSFLKEALCRVASSEPECQRKREQGGETGAHR